MFVYICEQTIDGLFTYENRRFKVFILHINKADWKKILQGMHFNRETD